MSLNNCMPASFFMDIARANGAMYQKNLDLDLDLPIWVFVKPEYLTDITVQTKFFGTEGKHNMSTTSSQDHPSFLATKERLERDGYIETMPWWNGDVVLKPFYFNNVYLDVNDSFKCAAALGLTDMFIEHYNDGKILEGVRNYKNEGEEYW